MQINNKNILEHHKNNLTSKIMSKSKMLFALVVGLALLCCAMGQVALADDVLLEVPSLSSDVQPNKVNVYEESDEADVSYGSKVMYGWVAKTHRRLQSCNCRCGCCGGICGSCCRLLNKNTKH